MQLVEKHIVNIGTPLYKECDRICFASKNIYNRSMYLIKQDWENNKSYDTLDNLYHVIKDEECYTYLPPKVVGQTIRMVQSVWKGFFATLKAKKEGKIDGDVNPPKYLNKKYGRYVARYINQAISKKVFNKTHKIKLSQCDIEFHTKVERYENIACVDIVPKLDCYEICVVYNVPDIEQLKSNRTYAGIDLGVNNLATITSNKQGFQPFIINGRPLKSVNQYYNKCLAHYKSKLDKDMSKYKSSHRIKRLVNKRNNKVNDYLHKASKLIADKLSSEDIRMLVIGKNDGWKQGTDIGKANNQNFVMIPHSRFIQMLKYKCERKGIRVFLVEESHTSKCSFLDLESIEHHDTYVGKRIKRGLFRSSNGTVINADVNGSYNIIRKAVPTCFKHNGMEGVVVRPLTITVKN